ncbi:MAG TPA: YceH family protein [Acidimicrobiales bacterium]|nr:YceH family protein [Acidimicrobiales bacterium]
MPEAAGTLGLTAIEARVVGALLEKELTTPDAYPLTLKALIAACNQSSNRAPVVSYGNHEVENTVLALKAKGLARVVHPGSGERATRYRQVVDEAFGLAAADRALMCSLLLRGAQTARELKARSERLHAFASTDEVEAGLQALARRDPPLVARINRRPGQKEDRWIQLLEVGAEERAAAVTPAAVGTTAPTAGRMEELEARVAALETRLASLVEALDGLVAVRRPTEGASPEGEEIGSSHGWQ